ncbi:transglutaminase family protein [Stappia sp.]|uniref:transglutaminase family protein n=1 Tax=Stappia sp. TaxID=1870903 RepID=UPI0032D947B3
MTQATLSETSFLDYCAPEITRFLDKHLKDTAADKRAQAVTLYYAVRDKLFYEIYDADFSEEGLTASAILRKGSGLCIHKSIVYAALLRRIGVPSRLWFTDVRNHLCSERLTRLMGDSVFHYHCLVSMELDGDWIKATPVFNKRLCQLFRMTPLEFDGYEDSLHHPFDENGHVYMEILKDHGEFDDVPHMMILNGMREKHGELFATATRFLSGALKQDALVGAR